MKSRLKLLCTLGILAALIFAGKQAAAGAKLGLHYCLEAVIPSLFPFLFLSGVLQNQQSSRILETAGKAFRLPPGQGRFLITAFAAGYPVGAGYTASQARAGQIVPASANRLLRFCGNPGPGFLFGMLHPYFTRRELFVLWGIQIASGWLLSAWIPPVSDFGSEKHETSHPLTEILKNSLHSMAQICGWIVLFQTALGWILPLLPESPALRACAAGFLEMTSGIRCLGEVTSPALRFLLAQGLLGFGGVCVMLQTASVIAPLPVTPYLQGKLLQSVVGLVLAWAYLERLWIVPLALFFSGLVGMGIFPKKGSFFSLRHV